MALVNSALMAPPIGLGLPPKMAKFCHTSNIMLVGTQRRHALSLLYFNSSAAGRSVGWPGFTTVSISIDICLCLGYIPLAAGYPLAQGKYHDIFLITISMVELNRSYAKIFPTMITKEEERRISATAAISASATAFRVHRCHMPTSDTSPPPTRCCLRCHTTASWKWQRWLQLL
jgi:hypothetical protein